MNLGGRLFPCDKLKFKIKDLTPLADKIKPRQIEVVKYAQSKIK